MFSEPDWSQSVDFKARLAAVPPNAVVRGMFLQLITEAIPRETKAKPGLAARYLPFKTYPLREYIELLELATRAAPLPAAECVRRIGWRVYRSYASTITGTAIFAIAGIDFGRVIELASSAYKVALDPSDIRVRTLNKHYAHVELRDLYNLPDFHQVGIWEGAMKACGVIGEIKTRVFNYGAVDFEVRWE
ncbi:MAG: hypothetical protein RL701_501 [Pseudomonadota bacterium]|jgi:uncharacterized protein (TIGR02265 family)